MQVTMLGAAVLLVVLTGMLYASGLLQQEFPSVATWCGRPAAATVLTAPSSRPSRVAAGVPAVAPRRSAGLAPQASVGPALELDGISWAGTSGRSVAVINHRALAIGEAINGYVLRRITATSVELTGHGECVRLRSNATRDVTPLGQPGSP